MENEKWRPGDWVNPVTDSIPVGILLLPIPMVVATYEAGADAMYEALVDWLRGRCDNPTHVAFGSFDENVHWFNDTGEEIKIGYLHRKDCPRCMAEIKKERDESTQNRLPRWNYMWSRQ